MPRTVTVTLTAAQADALRRIANVGIRNANESLHREVETARRALVRLVVATGKTPHMYAGEVRTEPPRY